MSVNPFRPTFGSSPPVLVGRDALVDQFSGGLEEGPGAPDRATLYTGTRGSGKTCLLNTAEDAATSRGWWTISETANAGLVSRFVSDHLPRALAEVDTDDRRSTLTGVSGPFGLGANWQSTDDHRPMPSLRSQLALLTELMDDRDAGVLVSLDEVHGGDIDELRELCTTVQHLIRENRQIAFVAAGLPDAIQNRLLRDPVLTFLRRAERHRLGMLSPLESADGLRIPIERGGRSITDDALAEAVELTAGYAYMVQVVGHTIWKQDPQRSTIDTADVAAARPAAIERVGRLVHDPSLAALSDRDRQFLAAMALDSGPSKMSDIAERLGVDKNYASQYRRRLLATELIEAPQRGAVAFALPYLRDHVRGLDIPLDHDELDLD